MIVLAQMLLFASVICGAKIKMIDVPFAFNNAASGARNHGDNGEVTLMARVVPQKPSGPQYLIENLYGKCFSTVLNTYKYEFCPFHNVTQREQTYRWNAFHGVLGIWKEWNITNNTFTSMHMIRGEVCSGSLDREIQVTLSCGKTNEIVSVKEPTMCRYNMLFKTPYACPQDVFLVYPMLSQSGKTRWREIERQFDAKEITRKGYEKRTKQLYVEEGLNIDERLQKKNKYKKGNKENTTPSSKSFDPSKQRVPSYHELMYEFATKSHCIEEYRKVLIEVSTLREKVVNLTEIVTLMKKPEQNLTGWT